MDGGGDNFRLGDIGDFKETDDLWSIASAALVSMNVGLAATRLGGLGGLSLNTYFDTFGIEGYLANISWVTLLFQAARWLYTTFYTIGAAKSWSPFVFVCVLIFVQLIHDLLFYYGLIRIVPGGKNEIVDALRKYANENGSRALLGHAVFLIFTAFVAMWLKETTFIFSLFVVNLAIYFMPLLITTFGPKLAPPPVAKAPPKKEEAFRMSEGGSMRSGMNYVTPMSHMYY